MRRALAWLAVAAALAGCGDSRPTATGPDGPSAAGRSEPEPREQIGRLLTRRAAALEDADVEAYAATSVGGQRAKDRTAARNLRGLPVSGFDYDITGAEVGRRRAVLMGTLVYEVPGGGSFSVRRRIVAVRRHGEWRVMREGGARDRFPWEVEAYRAERLEHFTVLAPSHLNLEDLPARLEAARSVLGARLVRPRPRARYLVVVARDAAAAERMTAFIRGTDGLAAITDAKVRDEGPQQRVRRVVSLRLLVVAANFNALGVEERQQVLEHELTHAVLTRVTSGRVPAWLNEGIALYLSDDRRVDRAAELVTGTQDTATRRALTLSGLSRPDAIARLDGEAQSAAYAYASAAVHYVAERFGERRLLRLYESFNDADLPGSGGVTTTDAATREILDRPLTVLERDLRRWIVTRAIVDPFAP